MEAMSDDPECKHLVQKQKRNVDDKRLEIVTEEQRHEQIAHARRAIMAIQLQEHCSKMERRLNATMMEALLNQMQVAEIYSPPRVAAMAKKMELGSINMRQGRQTMGLQ